MKLRKAAKSAVFPEQLIRVQRRLERWRQSRQQRCPIPEAIWIASATVARDCGLGRTARALRLDYYTLKKRLTELEPPASIEPHFVELVPPSAAVGSECTIEMEHPGGARMHIRLKGAGVPDWAALSHAFWGTAP